MPLLILGTNRVIQKRQGTPCTPKQCHKPPRKVQKATPELFFLESDTENWTVNTETHGSRRSARASQASHHAPANAVVLEASPPEIRQEAPPEDEMQDAGSLLQPKIADPFDPRTKKKLISPLQQR